MLTENRIHGIIKIKGLNAGRNNYQAILSKLQTGTMPKNNKMTFSEAADIFMRLHANKKCKPNTEHGYHGYLKNHLLPYFGKIK